MKFPQTRLKPLGPTRFSRRGQSRWRDMLHDPRCTLAAQHTLVDRVIPVALDVPDLTIFQVDLDPATAGAHVAGGCLDFITRAGVQFNNWLVEVFLFRRFQTHLPFKQIPSLIIS